MDLPNDVSWTSEARQADTGRVDVEGHTPDGTPVVKIEAKLGAELAGDQLRSYALDLSMRSGGEPAALLVLVPDLRHKEAQSKVHDTFSVAGSPPWCMPEYPAVSIAVVSWERLLAALEAEVSPECRDEARQLAGLYRGTCGHHIAPVRSIDELRNWRRDEDNFIALVDEVTRELSKGRHAVYPMSRERTEDPPGGLEPKGYNRRYVCRSRGRGPCFSIGVRDPFEGPGDPTPIWLRFNGQTDLFGEIRRQIEASRFAARRVLSGPHLWLPLEVPRDQDGPHMVAALVSQALAIMDVAYALLPPEATAEGLNEATL